MIDDKMQDDTVWNGFSYSFSLFFASSMWNYVYDGIDDTEHFLLLYPCFDLQRQNLLAGIYALIRPLGYVNLKNEALLKLLLYGDDDFPNSLNRHILELTLHFIHETDRFEWSSIIYPIPS